MNLLRIARTSTVIVALACLWGCDKPTPDSAAANKGLRLAASLDSKQAPEYVRAQLERTEWSNWRVVDQPQGNAAGGRPDFRVLSAEVDGPSLGIQGTLRVDFLNDRLMATWFFPSDFAAYRSAIQQLPPSDPLRNAIFGTDYRNRQYALLEDPLLRKEMEAWIRKYS